MAVDALQRKLKFPPKYSPYLDKHRIFELFHEIAVELVKQRPRDHLTFVKDILIVANWKRNRPRIVFTSPPGFDRVEFSEAVVRYTGVLPIYRDLLNKYLEEAQEQLEHVGETGELSQVMLTGTEDMYYGSEGITWQERLRRLGLSLTDIKLGETCICGRFFQGLNVDNMENMENMENVEIVVEEETTKIVKIEPVGEEEGEVWEEEERIDYSNLKCCPCELNKRRLKLIQDALNAGASAGGEDTDKDTNKNKETQGGSTQGAGGAGGAGGEGGAGGGGDAGEDEGEEGEEGITGDEMTDAEKLSNLLAAVLNLPGFLEFGWILVDMPENAEEAKAFQRAGILPTHALQISDCPKKIDMSDSLRHCQKYGIIGGSFDTDKFDDYRLELIKWKEVYNYVPINEVFVCGRTYDELGIDMSKIVTIMPHHHPPLLPRVLLVGARGSGARTQARKLEHKLKLVHVDLAELLEQTKLLDDELSEKYKQQLRTNDVDVEVLAAILERKLLSYECLKHGWIMTGYPRNVTEFRVLDMLETPPNRVIFFKLEPRQCYARIHYRQTDSCTGEIYRLPDVKPNTWGAIDNSAIDYEVAVRLRQHPTEHRQMVVRAIEKYFNEEYDMLVYCGRTAAVINGDASITTVFEYVQQIIINSAPACLHRKPFDVPTDEQQSQELKNIYKNLRLLTEKNVVLVKPFDTENGEVSHECNPELSKDKV